MDSADLDRLDIFDIYRRYCDIKSRAYTCSEQGYTSDDEPQKDKYSREALAQLLILVESREHVRFSIFDELFKLLSRLNLMVDFSEFSRFYDFVFFVCRENGQKNITVSRAVMAWRLVLAGRFRLLDQWCNFVERNQRHNISEDTWRQVLAFSRCVHENLEGYDPEGAWPILIDDFVEHMYRITGSDGSALLSCNCVDSKGQPLEEPLPGLKIVPGLKRKSWEDFKVQEPDASGSSSFPKRRLCYFADNLVKHESMEIVKHSSSNSNSMVAGSSKSSCAVEGCLSKGFAGLFSGRSCLRFGRAAGLGQPGQLNAERGISYM
ncbi:hypothetical protein LguiA_006357 [Lonicera macranthoides]